jgi:regulator of nucleoside diphosphate kinase
MAALSSDSPHTATAPSGSISDVQSQARIVSRLDRDRLYDAVPYTVPLAEHVSSLFRLLAVATPVAPERIPPDLVTMNSVVCLRDLETGEADTHDLVYPFEAELRPFGRSVTAPLGAALFGRSVGDHVVWRTGRGERRAVIDALQYQPEREGHYDL